MARRGFANLLLLAVSLVVSFLAAELALPLTGRVHVPPAQIVSERPELYEEFRPHGYRLWPSRVSTYQYPRERPRELTLSSNRHGFRGQRELDELDGRRRIVVLGDSMVFGQGVEERERFTDQIEAAEPGWRIDNLGMTGFGPDLMLRAFEQVGAALRPSVVVLTLYTDDFRRVRPEYAGAGFHIPRYTLRGGQLLDADYPRLAPWSRLATVTAVREILWRRSRAEWALNEAILDRFREHAAQSHFTLLVVFLPGRSDTPSDRTRRSWLRDYVERTHTAFFDLTDALLAHDAPPLFIPGDPHLNPEGHAVVAQTLRRVLAELPQKSE